VLVRFNVAFQGLNSPHYTTTAIHPGVLRRGGLTSLRARDYKSTRAGCSSKGCATTMTLRNTFTLAMLWVDVVYDGYS